MTISYRQAFRTHMGVKDTPNEHEQHLFARANKYARILSYIPGIQMIAVVNSLAMYATHPDSDIDFFIVTRPGQIWFVRFWAIVILWICGVWRHGQDIAGNICLSFFVTTDAMDLEPITIPNDIYLAFWIESMKVVYDIGGIYESFMSSNIWIEKYTLGGKMRDAEREERGNIKNGESEGGKLSESQEKQYTDKQSERVFSPLRTFDTFSHKSIAKINSLLRFFLLPRALKTYEEKGYPSGVIISDSMLKFHDQDRRQEIRDEILKLQSNMK